MTIAVHGRRLARLKRESAKAEAKRREVLEFGRMPEMPETKDLGVERRAAVDVLTRFARELAGYQPPPQWLCSTPPGSEPPPSLPGDPDEPRPDRALHWWEEEPQIPGEMPSCLMWLNVPAPPANATGTIEFDRATRRWIPWRKPADPRRVLTTEEAMKLPVTYDVPIPYPPNACLENGMPVQYWAELRAIREGWVKKPNPPEEGDEP